MFGVVTVFYNTGRDILVMCSLTYIVTQITLEH